MEPRFSDAGLGRGDLQCLVSLEFMVRVDVSVHGIISAWRDERHAEDREATTAAAGVKCARFRGISQV